MYFKTALFAILLALGGLKKNRLLMQQTRHFLPQSQKHHT